MIKHSVLLFFFALILCSCGKNNVPRVDKLTEKSEPYDLFAFQRSYPDRDFDWKGWRKMVQQTRTSEKVQSRDVDCGTNLSNWTQQGPMNVGARCNTLALKPDDENTVLAGFSGGGIFKSTDGGINWRPVFDENPELAIGDITFAPSNPNIVYAGTGDPNIPSIVFNGDGIYKSVNAGETWQHLSNSPSGIVSKIVVHPNDPNILWAGTMGNPYIRDNQRGIYKSTDGGNSWQQVLFVSNQAGASDLVQCPTNPQILYASFWDRIRNNFESVVYGPHSKVYKSVDGGNTWSQLGGGLPTTAMGRSGLAISRTDPNKVYAVFVDSLNTPGGLYKTTDGGSTWTPLNIVQLEDACSDFAWYFGKICTNPSNDEELYFHAILLWRRPAGSSSWLNAGGGHADSHDLVFGPSGRRYWSNDGGVYRNDGQASWVKAKNLPVTQFYRTTYNLHEPNTYWGGAQDNGIQKGNGINPNNWFAVFSADGFSCAFDPADPNHFWIEIQNGAIHETSDGGNSWEFGTTALGSSDRTNWDTPFFMSPNTPNRLFAATYRVYSKDAGGGWGALSGDLTDGPIPEARFHTISCLSESPLTANKLVAGTTDGNVWRASASGVWTNITAGLPNRYVTSVRYSPSVSNRIFVTHSGFRDNDNIPHIHRSDDNGATWQDISFDLPPVPVNDLFILPGFTDQVLFAATDAGVYFSITGGQSWKRLGGNMPYIPVFDLEHNIARKELVAATFARGIWTFPLDSVFVQQNPIAVSLSGMIRDETGAGVTAVNLNGVLSNANGTYAIPDIPGCALFTVEPSRNDNPLNGLTTYDLVLISKHILGLEPFNSPYKMIAADANRSGSITTFDMVLLRKLILGIDTALSSNTSWRFVPANHVFDNALNPFQSPFPETLAVQVMTNPLTDLDFTAIKIGDVNNTAVPSFNENAEERTLGKWPIQIDWSFTDIGSKTSQNGFGAPFQNESLEALVSIPSGGILAGQFTLQFDREQMVFERVEPLIPDISADNFGLNRVGMGLISFSFEQNSPSDPSKLFKLFFRAKRAIKLPAKLHLSNWPTPGLLYRADGLALKPELESGEIPNLNPNPFGLGGAWITAGDAEKLEIFEADGKLLFSKYLASREIFYLNAGLFPRPGVYFWRLGKVSGKLVFVP